MRDLRSKKGLTLVELLIAAAILSVALLGIAEMFPSAYQNVATGGRLTRATFLAEQQLEPLRGQSFASLTARVAPYIDPGNPIDGTYLRQWSIHDNSLDSTIPGGMKRIRVQVTWAGPFGNREVTLATLVAP